MKLSLHSHKNTSNDSTFRFQQSEGLTSFFFYKLLKALTNFILLYACIFHLTCLLFKRFFTTAI